MVGLIITLVAVLADAWYVTAQISRLQTLQTTLADRSRRDSLQLLRIQNDLNQLGLAMRDMVDGGEPYPLTAWSSQFDRIRRDLDEAIRLEGDAAGGQSAEQREYLRQSIVQFWNASDRVFAEARRGSASDAREQVRLSLEARQAAVSTTVARLLVQNNQAQSETAVQVQAIYGRVHRQVYWFVAATLAGILLTGLYVIRSNRRLFAALGASAEERRELAQQLIATRESTLREIARELHDELGQVLTAIGSMVGRVARQMPVGSALQTDLREVRQIAQATLDKVRGLSQSLHPGALEQAGLEAAVDWHVSTLRRHAGLDIEYERSGPARAVDQAIAIQVYRILQESLNNVVKHAAASRVYVRLRLSATRLELEVEDRGKGVDPRVARRGLGIVGMRERAALVGGTITFERPDAGGTLMRLEVPLEPFESHGGVHSRAG